MKTVLITGSNGLLGQKLVELFGSREDWKVIATSFSPDKMNGQGYDFELLDITSPVEIAYLFDKYKPDTLINTAAMTQVDTCEDNRDDCHRINVEAVQSLADACQKIKAHLIHLSSDFVFSGKKGRYLENDRTEPVNLYGKSKAESEKLLMNHSVEWSIVRTSLVYGVNPETARPNLILWLRHALGEKQVVKINNDQFRTPTLAEDLALGCFEIANGRHKGIYHLAGGDYLSVMQVANAVAEVFKLDADLITPVSSAELPEKGKRPLKGGLDISKAWKDFGYRPHSLVEGLKLVKKQLAKPRFTLDV